jgi:hypothetical protein
MLNAYSLLIYFIFPAFMFVSAGLLVCRRVQRARLRCYNGFNATWAERLAVKIAANRLLSA